MSDATTSELAGLEQEYWRAIQAGDIDRMTELTDFPCILTGGQGVVCLDAAHLRAMMEADNWHINHFELTDLQVRLLADDVALVAYKVSEKLTVEGEKLSLDAADSSVWVRRGERWRCAHHSEARLGDPFGREQAAS